MNAMFMKLFGIVDTAELNFSVLGSLETSRLPDVCFLAVFLYRSSGDKVGLGRGWVWQFIVPSGNYQSLKSQEFQANEAYV
jgi:hypothetical protein